MFSNTTDLEKGIIQQIEKLTGIGDTQISGNATYLKQFTGDINNAYSREANIILRVDGRMQWDDPNHSNSSAATADLVDTQKKYEVFEAAPAALQDWLQVEKVEILSEDDLGLSLAPIDILDITNAESEFRDVDGTPEYFDFDGAEVKLYPSPDYDKTDGLIIFFKRSPSFFASDDTTKVPGFATLFHVLLVLWPVYWWGVRKGLGYVRQVRNEITILENELKKFYTRRPKFDDLRLVPETDNFI